MATSIVEINKKRCVKCDDIKSGGGGGGLFTCDGCQQMFCARHVGEHRQELSTQLENAMQEHDLIQQESSQSTLGKDILKKVDVWEKESIITIQKIAETTRANLHKWYQNTNDRIKTKCSELAKNLRVARETDGFSESDLIKWNQILANLRTQLELMKKVNITEDKQSSVHLIKVQHHNNWPTKASLRKDSNLMTKKHSDNTTSPSNTIRHDDQHLQISSRSTTVKRTESDDNQKKPPECKQQ